MNKITRKRPNKMYEWSQYYRAKGVYCQFSIINIFKSYRKFRKQIFRFRNGKSGRYSTVSKILDNFEELTRYER